VHEIFPLFLYFPAITFYRGVHGLLQVVDIGSGRGYLGCHLALMYHIPVVGIDSSPSNTDSAAERTRLLRKHWRGLVSLSYIVYNTVSTISERKLCWLGHVIWMDHKHVLWQALHWKVPKF